MRAAYDALDDETKAEIDDLVCEHSLMYSRGSLGFTEYTDDEKGCSSRCCSVWCAPTGARRKSLYLSSHAGKIVSMSVPEGGCCCAISTSTRRNASSSTSTNGAA